MRRDLEYRAHRIIASSITGRPQAVVSLGKTQISPGRFDGATLDAAIAAAAAWIDHRIAQESAGQRADHVATAARYRDFLKARSFKPFEWAMLIVHAEHRIMTAGQLARSLKYTSANILRISGISRKIGHFYPYRTTSATGHGASLRYPFVRMDCTLWPPVRPGSRKPGRTLALSPWFFATPPGSAAFGRHLAMGFLTIEADRPPAKRCVRERCPWKRPKNSILRRATCRLPPTGSRESRRIDAGLRRAPALLHASRSACLRLSRQGRAHPARQCRRKRRGCNCTCPACGETLIARHGGCGPGTSRIITVGSAAMPSPRPWHASSRSGSTAKSASTCRESAPNSADRAPRPAKTGSPACETESSLLQLQHAQATLRQLRVGVTLVRHRHHC